MLKKIRVMLLILFIGGCSVTEEEAFQYRLNADKKAGISLADRKVLKNIYLKQRGLHRIISTSSLSPRERRKTNAEINRLELRTYQITKKYNINTGIWTPLVAHHKKYLKETLVKNKKIDAEEKRQYLLAKKRREELLAKRKRERLARIERSKARRSSGGSSSGPSLGSLFGELLGAVTPLVVAGTGVAVAVARSTTPSNRSYSGSSSKPKTKQTTKKNKPYAKNTKTVRSIKTSQSSYVKGRVIYTITCSNGDVYNVYTKNRGEWHLVAKVISYTKQKNKSIEQVAEYQCR